MSVHETAVIHPGCTVHPDAEIGPYCVLGSDDGPLNIPAGSILRSHTVIYGGVHVGTGLRTGHHALIRGKVHAGRDLHLGSYSSIEGTVRIGDDVKIQGRCEVADSFVHDGARLWVGCYVCDNNDPPDGEKEPPTIGARAKVYARVTIMPGTVIGDDAVVAAEAPCKGVIPAGHLLTRSGKLFPTQAVV